MMPIRNVPKLKQFPGLLVMRWSINKCEHVELGSLATLDETCVHW
jgi:hypothetical protein